MNSHEQNTVEQSNSDVDNNNDNEEEYYTTILTQEQYYSTKLQEKADIHTQVNEKTLDTFKNFVIKKHGKLHSRIGFELEIALDMYNKFQDRQQRTTSLSQNHYFFDSGHKSVKVRTDVEAKFFQIKKELTSFKSYPELSILSIKAIVKEVLGNVDSRTLKKYLNAIFAESKIMRVGISGSWLNVKEFVESNKTAPKLSHQLKDAVEQAKANIAAVVDVATLAPTEEEDKKLV